MSSRAQAVADHLAAHGASFFDELLAGTRLLHTELEDALGELVAAGLINADSFSGLRALLVPSSKRPSTRRRHGRRTRAVRHRGRRPLVAGAPAQRAGRGQSREHGHEARRRGDRTRRARAAASATAWSAGACSRTRPTWLPPWRELLRVYHRLEARGEIRGGRFVAGLVRRAVRAARSDRVAAQRCASARPTSTWVCVCGADPLNLVGSVLAGDNVPRVVGSRVLYRDGVPVAKRVAGATVLFETATAADEHAIRMKLLRGNERTLAHEPARSLSEEE